MGLGCAEETMKEGGEREPKDWGRALAGSWKTGSMWRSDAFQCSYADCCIPNGTLRDRSYYLPSSVDVKPEVKQLALGHNARK